MLARSKLNKIETMISRVLIDSEICHQEYTKIVNEEEKCRKLKEDISQRSDTEKMKRSKKGKELESIQ